MSDQERKARSIDRRWFLQGLGVATATGLAGCGSSSDGSGDENSGGNESPGENENLGEKVPPIDIEYWSNLATVTNFSESVLPGFKKDIEEAIDHEVNVKPVEFSSQVDNVINDTRSHQLSFWVHFNVPDRLDPQEMTRRYSIDWAGTTGRDNPPQFANCEYTDLAVGQESAKTETEREEMVHNAHSILSEELATIPVVPNLEISAVNTDTVDATPGGAGLGPINPSGYIKTTPKGKDTLVVNIDANFVQTLNYPTIGSSNVQSWWNQLTHSGLTMYDENYELKNILAKSIEVSNEGRTITAELKDATFHNGDPITSEDVKFTFEQLSNNPGSYSMAGQPPYESIEIIDDRTTEFNFSEPFLAMKTKTMARWGIFHKETWVNGGGDKNPEDFEFDPFVGSGPFTVENFQAGQSIELSPHDDHPVFSPDHNLFFRVYQDQTSMVEAFLSDEVDYITGVSPGSIDRITGQKENSEIISETGFLPYLLYPQTSFAPMKFREMRKAIGTAINRDKANQLGYNGRSEPAMFSTPLMENHPYRPSEDTLTKFTDDPQGDSEAARKALTDAGWGWDSNGNLRYPSDADLSARWPKESVPQPEDFPCIDGEGNYKE
ncbi:ABC transporter substrate-binding protein [Halorussus salinisoli]|uniref:ABC transporter substrate-binding protein n=1 Tax=Halorussus salinisoli TaxID=2558242 RepID=UPI0010C1B848|nr:ABC transporter substrate-binding protein [Halorussus salinisoli]